MDEHDDSRRTVGTVKAASNLFGDSNGDISPWPKKSQMNNSEKSSSRTTELHITRRDVGRYRETRKAAESAKVEAESELSNAKKKVKENDDQYAEVMRELVLVKQELQKLKLDVASVLKEKSRAEKEIQESRSNILSRSKSAEAIKKEIEEANEEQVLVELARIEALKEFGDIEAEREKEASQFSTKMENNKKKLKDIIYEIDNSKELEAKLAMTLCDVDVLQNELNLFKEMDRRVRRSGSMKHLEGSFRKEEESETLPSLQTITEELETAKKELASIREEGFQFMGSMDIVRNELNHVISETAQMQKTEEKTELTIQNLNSKLLRASSKLETVSAAEDKAKSIVTNLSVTLQQVKREIEDARKEKELIDEKSIAMKAEIQKTESEIDIIVKRLQASMQELEAVKSSEALALDKLKSLIEDTIRRRASAARHSSMITISKFEYEYLTKHAAGAEEVADKKVAAAQAWVEALKASEKEILMKTEMTHREIRKLRVEEEMEFYTREKSLSAKKLVTGELENRRGKREKNAETTANLERASSRKTVQGNGNSTPSRRAKFRKTASPGAKHLNSFTLKKRKKVMPNLAKFFSGKKPDTNR